MPDIEVEVDRPDDEILADTGDSAVDEPTLFAEEATDDEIAKEEKPAKKSSWLKDAAGLKKQAEEAKAAAEEARRELAATQERLARLESQASTAPIPKREQAKAAAKRDLLSGEKLYTLIDEKGEAGLHELLEGVISDKLAAQKAELEEAFSTQMRARDTVASVVAQHRFLADEKSEGFKMAEQRQRAAAKADPTLGESVEVWKLSAEIADLKMQLAETKSRRKAGSGSVLVGDGEGDEYVELPEFGNRFLESANAHLGPGRGLTRQDLMKAIRSERRPN